MADKYFKIAALLTATDNMSSVVDAAVNKSMGSADKLQRSLSATNKAVSGYMMMNWGKQGLNAIKQTTDAYGDMEAASLEMQSSLMKKGGVLDTDMVAQLVKQSQYLSDNYANNATAYLDMVRVLKNNKIDEKDILGGIGEATAKLADLFQQMNPATVGEFAARMKNDFGISAKEMTGMMDILARVRNVGVGKTGEETVSEMNEFFSKVGLGLANLHVSGLQAGSDMAALGTVFMRRGISGQTVGTNFRRILDGLRDPERVMKANSVAHQFGKDLQFFDKAHNFMGIENFVTQLNKLQGLDPNKISEILKPFSGRQGLSTDFLEFLANDGVTAFNDIRKSMAEQATMDEKLSKIMSGLNYQKKVFDTSWQNTKAVIGGALSGVYTSLYKMLNNISKGIRDFVELHPQLTKAVLVIGTIGSSLLALGGAIKIIQGVTSVMRILNLTLMANPIGLVAAAFAAAAMLIYSYWDDIPQSFKDLLGILWDIQKIVWKVFDSVALEPFIDAVKDLWKILKPLLEGMDSVLSKITSITKLSLDDFTRSIGIFTTSIGINNDKNKEEKKASLLPFNNPMNVTYSPNITIHGNADLAQQVKATMGDQLKEFDRLMNQWDANNKRKRF